MIDILFISLPLVDYDKRNIPIHLVNTSFFPPIGLAYLSAYLEQYKFTTEIIDMDAEKYGLSMLPKLINHYKPKLIGISIAAENLFQISRVIMKKIREIVEIPIIIGGVYPTCKPDIFFNQTGVDFIVKGEGEETLLELIRYLLLNEGTIEEIKGISYKNNGAIIHNPNRELIKNLDEIPFPAWYKFPIKRYFISIAHKNPCFAITASRGCSFRCIFCATSVFEYRRSRSPKNVIDEIEFLIKNYKIKDISFHDPTFNTNTKWVISFCKEILRRKIRIKWRCLCRVDNISENMIAYMKAAGCYCIAFGIETSQDKFLKFLRKDFTIKQVENAVKITKKNKIEIFAFFMLGIPGQKVADLEHNVKFINHHSFDYINVLSLIPPKCTELYEIAKKNGWLIKDFMETFEYPEKIGTQHQIWKIPNLSQEIVYYYIKKAYITYFLNPKTIKSYIEKYISHPSRIFNAIRNIIHRYNYNK